MTAVESSRSTAASLRRSCIEATRVPEVAGAFSGGVAPFLILGEIQTGAWLRSGSFLSLTLQTVKATGPWAFGLDLLLGSVVIGGAVAAV